MRMCSPLRVQTHVMRLPAVLLCHMHVHDVLCGGDLQT